MAPADLRTHDVGSDAGGAASTKQVVSRIDPERDEDLARMIDHREVTTIEVCGDRLRAKALEQSDQNLELRLT